MPPFWADGQPLVATFFPVRSVYYKLPTSPWEGPGNNHPRIA